jgi:hypothetical protein
MIRVLGMLGAVIIGVLCMAPAARAQDEGPAIYVAWEFEEVNPTGITGYRCVTYPTCPSGTFQLKSDGTFYGCTWTCSGECRRCVGGGQGMSRCELHHGAKCYPSVGGITSICGEYVLGTCNSSDSKGYSAPGGGCYCDVPVPGVSVSGSQCKVMSCLPDN